MAKRTVRVDFVVDDKINGEDVESTLQYALDHSPLISSHNGIVSYTVWETTTSKKFNQRGKTRA